MTSVSSLRSYAYAKYTRRPWTWLEKRKCLFRLIIHVVFVIASYDNAYTWKIVIFGRRVNAGCQESTHEKRPSMSPSKVHWLPYVQWKSCFSTLQRPVRPLPHTHLPFRAQRVTICGHSNEALQKITNLTDVALSETMSQCVLYKQPRAVSR